MRTAIIYTAAVAALLAGCGAQNKGPLTPGEGSPWVEYPNNVLGVTQDAVRGEVLFQAEPCPNAEGRQAVSLSLDGTKAWVGCWVDMSANGNDYVFVGWFGAENSFETTPTLAVYNFTGITWSELGTALVEAGKALQEAGQ